MFLLLIREKVMLVFRNDLFFLFIGFYLISLGCIVRLFLNILFMILVCIVLIIFFIKCDFFIIFLEYFRKV